MENITISQVLRKLEDELFISQSDRETLSRPSLFQLNQVELEMQVSIKSNSSVKGGTDIKVLSFQLGGETSNEHSHKIKLVLDVNKAKIVKGLPGVFPDQE